MSNEKLLIIDDEQDMGWLFEQTLGQKFDILTEKTWFEGKKALQKFKPSVVLLDYRLPDTDGLNALIEIKKISPEVPVIMITAFATISNAVEAIKLGAYDYQVKPFSIEQVEKKILGALETRKNKNLTKELIKNTTIIGQSKTIKSTIANLSKAAATNANILLLGESGTGKEIFAREIHRLSNRRDKPFVAINCAAVPENLMESELFGYEKGAFTGAQNRKIGKFDQAKDGTLMLDEIGDLPLMLQGKLLRVIEQREFERLGGTKKIDSNVRIISATNQDLSQMCKSGDFRSDLFYRLAVLPIIIPPLREREGDIEVLANYYLKIYNEQYNRNFVGFSEEVKASFSRYDWPGNVRELKNVIEQIIILNDGELIESSYIPEPIQIKTTQRLKGSLKERKSQMIAEIEKAEICAALKLFNGNRTKAAKYLKMSVRNVQIKIKEYNITDDDIMIN